MTKFELSLCSKAVGYQGRFLKKIKQLAVLSAAKFSGQAALPSWRNNFFFLKLIFRFFDAQGLSSRTFLLQTTGDMRLPSGIKEDTNPPSISPK